MTQGHQTPRKLLLLSKTTFSQQSYLYLGFEPTEIERWREGIRRRRRRKGRRRKRRSRTPIVRFPADC
jgi:hypothetical protein